MLHSVGMILYRKRGFFPYRDLREKKKLENDGLSNLLG